MSVLLLDQAVRPFLKERGPITEHKSSPEQWAVQGGCKCALCPELLCSPVESLGCAEVTQVLVQRHRQPNSLLSHMQFFLRSGRLCFKVSHCACSFSAYCCPLQAISRPDHYWQQSCGTACKLEINLLDSLLCGQAAPSACAEEKAPSQPWE